MRTRLFLLFAVTFIFWLMLQPACREYPSEVERDNPNDPKAVFDDQPPMAKLTITPDEGIVRQTEFLFDASASKEPEHPEALLKYKWDFNGDGYWDTELSTKAKINYVFSEAKLNGRNKIQAKVYVLGAKGLFSVDSQQIVVYTEPNPQMDWKISLANTRKLYFDASPSTDCLGTSDLLYRWDFDDDGNWDTGFSDNPYVEHIFPDEPEWKVRLEVEDQRGLRASRSYSHSIYKKNGLYLYYLFNGNAESKLTNNLDGFVYGAALTKDRFGNSQAAYYFDGIDDYISLGRNDLLQPRENFTISFWIKPQELNRPVLTSNFQPDNVDLGFYFQCLADGRMSFNAGPMFARTDPDIVKTDRWIHVVGVYTSSDHARLFINGGAFRWVNSSNTPHYIGYDSGDFRIGRVAGQYFKGAFDDLFFFDTQISMDDIENLYHLKN